MDDAVKRGRFAWLGPVLIGAALCVGAGSTLQARSDTGDLEKLRKRLTDQIERERGAHEAQVAYLNLTIETERKRRAADDQKRNAHWRAFTDDAVRVRNELQTMLEASRIAHDACTGRIAAVSEDIGQLDELLGQSVGLLEQGQAEITRLRGENDRLAAQIRGLLEHYAREHPQQITVTAKKPAG
jgi:chromosome segregation ATPase